MAINIPECLRPKSKGSAVRIIGTFGESLLKAQPNNPAIRTNDIDKRESGGGGYSDNSPEMPHTQQGNFSGAFS